MSENPSLYGIARIDSGVDFVQRWEASSLLTGLVSGSRAHSILLEVVRRLAQDRPNDLDDALARVYELQQFLNAMGGAADGSRAPELTPEALDELFARTRTLIRNTQPVLDAIRFTQAAPEAQPGPRFTQRGLRR